jgi:Pyridoxal/pyridoxine/pyridoxamine kinase
MNGQIPRVAAIHDLSCLGRCSLTVILPTLAVLGIQTCPLPTAVLSSHLGGYHGLSYCDFTEHIPGFIDHWRREGISFDCIYSGYLASERQAALVDKFISASPVKPLVLIDPVMGDNGRPYSTCTPALREQMKLLVEKADIITPNYTEACFLLGETYKTPAADPAVVDEWLIRLADRGPSKIVITGVPTSSGQVLNAGYDRSSRTFLHDYHDYLPASYPGTGDIFASVLLGAMLSGTDLPSAVKLAADFVSVAINATRAADTPVREGVLLEKVLPWLYLNATKTNRQVNEASPDISYERRNRHED